MPLPAFRVLCSGGFIRHGESVVAVRCVLRTRGTRRRYGVGRRLHTDISARLRLLFAKILGK
jgi:hypothetical protein